MLGFGGFSGTREGRKWMRKDHVLVMIKSLVHLEKHSLWVWRDLGEIWPRKKNKIRKQPMEQNALKAIIYPVWPWALPWSHFFPTWTGFEQSASECILLGEGWGSGCRGGEWGCLPTNVEDLQLSYSSCRHNLLHVINRRTGLHKPLSELQSWDRVMRTIWSLFTKTRAIPGT